MSVTTRHGAQYFIIFINDYTRYGHVYWMSHKSEALDKPSSVVHQNYNRSAPLGTYEAQASSSNSANIETRPVRRRSCASRSRRTNFDLAIFNPQLQRLLRIRERNRIRQERSRTTRSESQRIAARARQTIRQRNARHQQTQVQREATNAQNTAYQSVSRYRQSQQNSVHVKNVIAFRPTCANITWGSCRQCRVRFPGIKILNGLCRFCERDIQREPSTPLFSAQNDMDPGPVPEELSRLTTLGGSTIHHELAIPTDAAQHYKKLEGEQCLRMQEDFRDTKLIIIDEYSMLGKRMLANVDLRCRDIFAVDEPFGNVSVVLVGDMRQLPPVFDTPLYAQRGNTIQLFGGVSYSSFDKCVSLSQVFRQSGVDQHAYRDALDRLSIGKSTREDWKLFCTREYSNLRVEERNEFKYALRLFPTKAKAKEYNLSRLKELGKPIARINSINNCETASRAFPDEAKRLEQVLCLSEGARVMLRSNLATHHGLVNGAMGTVMDIIYSSGKKSPDDMPVAVMVEFDQYDGPSFREGTKILPITPQTSNWKTMAGVSCQRTQLPMVLCWAITVHKSQGLTLNKAVVDVGDKERLGITFVVLSRTRKLGDLAFNPMFTYDRLRKIETCAGLKGRMKEEERLCRISNQTD